MKRTLTLLAAAAMLALGACDSTTGSGGNERPSMRVELAGTSGAMKEGMTQDSTPVASCEVDLAATARGDAKHRAAWEGGTIHWYFGMDRSAPTDSTALAVDEIRKTWGTDLAGGETTRATWSFWAGAPFKARVVFRYREAGRAADTTSYTFTCGPTPPSGGVAKPSLSNVNVSIDHFSGSAGPVSPGAEIGVGYTGQSGAGVWMTGVVFSGAFSARVRFTEGLASFSSRFASVRVPADAPRGAPIVIQVFAVDPFLQTTVYSPPDTFRVREAVAPVLNGAYFDRYPAPAGQPTRLVGRYHERDSLWVRLNVTEPERLSWALYTVGGVRDSAVAGRGPDGTYSIWIGIPAGQAGASTFSIRVRNTAGLESNELRSAPDSFSVVPSYAASTRAATSDGATDEALVDDGRRVVYLSKPGSRRVEALSLATLAPAATYSFSAGPRGMDLTPRGDTLLVALRDAGAVAVVDLARPSAPPAEIPITAAGPGFYPVSVKVSATGRALVMGVDASSSTWKIVEMSTSGTGQRLRPDAGQGPFTAGMHRTADRDRILILGYGPVSYNPAGCTGTYSASSDSFGGCLPVGLAVFRWSSAPGGLTARGNVVYRGATDVRTFPLYSFIKGFSGLSPDGEFLYTEHINQMMRMRIADGQQVGRIPLPSWPDGSILFTRDGRYMVVVAGEATSTTRVMVVDQP